MTRAIISLICDDLLGLPSGLCSHADVAVTRTNPLTIAQTVLSHPEWHCHSTVFAASPSKAAYTFTPQKLPGNNSRSSKRAQGIDPGSEPGAGGGETYVVK